MTDYIRSTLPGVSQRNLLPDATRHVLDQTDAEAAAFLGQQHKPDGSHGAITCDSVIESGRGYLAAMGVWTDIPWDPTNFLGSGGMTWTVTAANQESLRFMRIGKTCFLNLRITGSSVGGVLSSILFLKLPPTIIGAGSYSNELAIVDAGTPTSGVIASFTNNQFLGITRQNGTNFTAAAGSTNVIGQLCFEIN